MKPFSPVLTAALLLLSEIAVAAIDPPRIALIIDDLGDQSVSARRTIALPGPVACAFLPGSPFSTRMARLAHENGKEVMLHLPMQPRSGAAAHPAALTTDTDRDQMVAALKTGLDSVPFATGVNNHQGSLLTQHPGHMAWLMEGLRENGGLFFVDSFTSGRSVAYDIASEQRIPTIKRDVFLDNERNIESIRYQFRRLVRIAKSTGAALGIGHPYPETLTLLEEEIPQLEQKYGVELVSVADLIATRDTGLLLVESGEAKPTTVAAVATPEPILVDVSASPDPTVSALRQKSADLLRELDAARRQNEELARIIRAQQEADEELERAQAELAALRSRDDESTMATEARDRLAAELEVARSQINSLRLAQQQQTAEREKLVAELAESRAARERLAQEVAELGSARNSSTELRAQLTQERQARSTLETELAALRIETDRLKAERSNVASTVETLKSETGQYAERLSALEARNRELEVTQAQLKSQLLQRDNELASARSELKSVRSESESMRVELTARAALVEKNSGSLSVIRQTLKRTEAALADRDQRLTESESALAAARTELAARDEALNSAQTRVVVLEERLAAREQELARAMAADSSKTSSARSRAEDAGKLTALTSVIRQATQDRTNLETELRDVQRQLRRSESPRLRARYDQLADDLRIINAKIRAIENVRDVAERENQGADIAARQLKLDTRLDRRN